MKQGIPQGYATVVVHGKARLVPIQGHRPTIYAQGLGRGVGYAASVAYTPAEVLIDSVCAVGRAVAETEMGVGVKHGWDQGQRAKVVASAGRAKAKSVDVEDLRLQCCAAGILTPEQARSMDSKKLGRLMADVEVPDSYWDDESYHAPVAQMVEKQAPQGVQVDEEGTYRVSQPVMQPA